jgi:sialate O-acetylesterase
VTDTGGAGGIYGLPEQIYAEMDSRRVALTDWKIKVGADKKDLPPLPQVSVRPNSLLYNGMIAPILPYGIRGAIWYQGESNVGRAYQYRTLFPAMIENWREDWGEGAFPFYFVQIAPFAYGANDMSAELREAQLLTLKLANTGMAVISDVTGNVQDIHPKDKRDVGARLALWALAQTYGKKGFEYSGPLYKSYKVDGNRIIVTFDHAVGLMAKGGAPTGFTIAGSDKKFVPAQAEIHGDTVIVTSPNVPNAAAVRFSWSDAGVHNLCNAAGLPASPFRTDTWPGLTDGVKW